MRINSLQHSSKAFWPLDCDVLFRRAFSPPQLITLNASLVIYLILSISDRPAADPSDPKISMMLNKLLLIVIWQNGECCNALFLWAHSSLCYLVVLNSSESQMYGQELVQARQLCVAPPTHPLLACETQG